MKRFYREAVAVMGEDGWHVALDGRQVKTQGGNALVVPNEALAQLLAEEWAAQGEEIDPKSFRHRDLADYAIDMVVSGREAAIAAILLFAETDTLCYRADPDEALWKRQQAMWDPLLTACEAQEGIKLQRVSGVMHRAQDPVALAKLRARLTSLDPFTLAALTTLASLAASLVIGLAALEPDAAGEALWNAASLEEDWQVEMWGSDSEAAERREKRKAGFMAAMEFARAARSSRQQSPVLAGKFVAPTTSAT